MNENPILPTRIYIFFPPLLYPKIFPPLTYHLPLPSYLPSTSPFLPTTYQPLPPSLHRQSSRDVERERAWSRGAVGAGARPTRDPSKHLTFFSLVYFVCLFVELCCIRYTTLQRIIAKKATLRCSAAQRKKGMAVTFFFFFVLQEKKKKKATTTTVAFFLLWSCAAMQQKKVTLLWSYATAQRSEEGDGSCRHLLLLLFCFFFFPL